MDVIEGFADLHNALQPHRQCSLASLNVESLLAWNTSFGPNGTLCHVVMGVVGGTAMVARFSSPPTFETAGRRQVNGAITFPPDFRAAFCRDIRYGIGRAAAAPAPAAR